MNVLRITVFRDLGHDSNGKPVPGPMTRPSREIILPITHQSISSEPLPSYATFISIKTDADCCLAFGPEPVADPQFHFVEAGERLWYGVHPGHRIAVVEAGLN